MPRVLTVGEMLVEVMTVETGQRFSEPGRLLGPYPSGAPAIFIDQAAKMGVKSGIIARVGVDDFGSLNRDRLKGDGVDVSLILDTPGYTTGTAFVTYFLNGERHFIFHFSHSAAGQLAPEDVQEEYFKDVEYLHIMGCSLSASESLRKAIWKAVRICNQQNTKISFDPNIRPELLGIDAVSTIFTKILGVTDILLSGESELRLLFRDWSLDSIITMLKEKGISSIILKDGSRGTRVFDDEKENYVPPFRVKEVDPTGAGDCFDGAFIASLVSGSSVQEAALIGNAAGALSVTRKGPMEGAAEKKEIMNLLNNSTN